MRARKARPEMNTRTPGQGSGPPALSIARLPWPRRRDAASTLSILAILLIVLLLAALLAVVHEREIEEERAALIKSTLWAEQNLHLQLSADEEQLRQLAERLGREGAASEGFLTQARHLIRTRVEFQRLLWLDTNGGLVLSLPPQEGGGERKPEARAAFDLARATGRAAYSAPVATRSGAVGFQVHQPVFDDESFRGVLVAVISLPELLNDHVPWWFAERYRLEVTDQSGTVLAAKSRVAADESGRSHTIALDPPGHGLTLTATVYRAETNLARNFLVAAILGLALAAIWSLWNMRRHSGRRARAEQALRAEHAFRKAMEDSLTVGMRARDLDGRITYVNPAFCRMVGWPAEELVGSMPPAPYWVPEEWERTLELHAAILSGRAPVDGFEIRFQRRDGQRFDALVYEAPLIDGEGRHTGWMGSVLDITDRKAAEDLARQQREALQHTSRLVVMGEMASAIAHELNQPLAAIASYATGCLNRVNDGDIDSDQLGKVLAKLSWQAQRAGHIIRRVYGFVRKNEPKIGRCELLPVLEDGAALMRPEAGSRGIRLELEVAGDLPPVEADPVQIGQVIANLARNGMEAMAATEKARRVLTIAARPDTGGVLVAVRDNGSGIPGEVAEQLFTPFFTTKAEGMGMGLNICRSIVEHHRGRLWFEPNPDGGSVFLFTLTAVRP